MEYSMEIWQQTKTLRQLLEYMEQELDEEMLAIGQELMSTEYTDSAALNLVHDRLTATEAQRRTVRFISSYMKYYNKYK